MLRNALTPLFDTKEKRVGTRIVTTDVEIIDAVIKAVREVRDGTTPTLGPEGYICLDDDEINHAAHLAVRKLTMPPEKTSDITGFKEDDEG